MREVTGFSKMSKMDKINWLQTQVKLEEQEIISSMTKFWHMDEKEQKIFDEFSENTLTNYYLPYGVAPNFLINGSMYSIPMVIEESSVVAAAAKGAKFWSSRGGIKAQVLGTTKNGQVHFFWKGDKEILTELFLSKKQAILDELKPYYENMEKRGGGILSVDLLDKSDILDHYYQFFFKFETCNAMGANFINSILEAFAKSFSMLVNETYPLFASQLEICMSILSNYTPECLVKAWVSCPVDLLSDERAGIQGREFAEKFVRAVKIAENDPYRAVTHNKGIFNGIDAVILATGNDFRATEACGHAYAARSGQYRSLSSARIEANEFIFELTLPIAVGTVGGLTNLHPLAKSSMTLLGQPSAQELMKFAVSVGLAQNFSAVTSLTTTGIQKGHMKMHLFNILKQMQATEMEVAEAKTYFADKVVSFNEVRNFLQTMRTTH